MFCVGAYMSVGVGGRAWEREQIFFLFFLKISFRFACEDQAAVRATFGKPKQQAATARPSLPPLP